MSNSMPPPSELSSHALCVSLRSSPFAVSHHQHHRHHLHHYYHLHYYHPTRNLNFSTSICPVLNGTMKMTGSSIHRYRKSDFEVCANTDRICFSPHDVCVRQYTSKWFCQSGDFLTHDISIDKAKAWCQQKRARSHVGFRTEWSPAFPVKYLPFVLPLLKFLITILNNFGEFISGTFLGIILGTSFGVVESCSGAASGTSFGEQILGRILGSSFKFFGIIMDLAVREIGFDNATLVIRFGN